jgi:hypothetical protein
LRIHITIQPVFDFAENHFHKNGLRAGPPAKYPSEHDGKENDEYYESEKTNSEDEKILWPENLSEKNKLTLQHIEQE